MALKVIGVGLGRTVIFSLKFALEPFGFGPCYHMSEVFAGARRNVPLWVEVVRGMRNWDAVFAGIKATTDYPACTYWRELADFYPDAKVVLTVRVPESWFDSVSETIFSEKMQGSLAGTPAGEMMSGVIFEAIGDRVNDRTFMTDWFLRRNQQVIDALPPDRLLVFSPRQGREPLCSILDVPDPDIPFPRVNSREEISESMERQSGPPPDPETSEKRAREYIDGPKARAFGNTG